MRLALSLSALLFAWAAEADARPVRLAETTPKAPLAAPAFELLVLHATNRKQGVAPGLKDLPELKKPPFSAYDSYAVLERIRLPLELARVRTHSLPNGRVLGAELLEVQKSDVLRLAASISEPGGHAFLPLLEVRAKVGQHFIVAGQKWKSGILVLVLTLVR
jgi:hypothetical protein